MALDSEKLLKNASPREQVRRYLNKIPIRSQNPKSDEADTLKQLRDLLEDKNVSLIAHYYTNPAIQSLAEETGGIVSDSLEMARFGQRAESQVLIIAGVAFMGETAKIISPRKRILMPSADATCSLDIGCPANQFEAFCDDNPDRTVVVYANTSAAVKARADWVVTSRIAVEVIDFLDSRGEKILWAPDRYLGSYVQRETGADMLLWDGSCVVHEEFKVQGVLNMLNIYPNAAILVHPESPKGVVDLADFVGSTSQLISAAREMPNPQLIVATDRGILYKMQQAVPDKQLLMAPTAGNGATCISCGDCPWMAMNTMEGLLDCLTSEKNEVHVDPLIADKAMVALNRMLDFKK